jgi:hypothetical protein
VQAPVLASDQSRAPASASNHDPPLPAQVDSASHDTHPPSPCLPPSDQNASNEEQGNTSSPSNRFSVPQAPSPMYDINSQPLLPPSGIKPTAGVIVRRVPGPAAPGTGRLVRRKLTLEDMRRRGWTRQEAIEAGWLIADSAPIEDKTIVDQPPRSPTGFAITLEKARVLGFTPEEAVAQGFLLEPGPELEEKITTKTEDVASTHLVLAQASGSKHKSKKIDSSTPVAGPNSVKIETDIAGDESDFYFPQTQVATSAHKHPREPDDDIRSKHKKSVS